MAYITPPDQLDGVPRRIQWTCRFCGHTFTQWTRRGLWVTCRKCGRGQEGPAGLARILDKEKAKKKPTTAVTVIAASNAAPKVVVKAKAKPAPAAKKASPPPPPAPPVTPKKDLLSRVMGF